MPSKPWFASKTIWFNAITVLIAVAGYFGWTPDTDLIKLVGGFLVAASPIINLALRLITHKAISPSR